MDRLEKDGAFLVHCDLTSKESIAATADALSRRFDGWTVLVIAAGLQDPVGPFLECDFDDWESSIVVNVVAQLRIVQKLMPVRAASCKNGPIVLFFAGGGTNNATMNYSAYTISKVALIKMCELLDAEIADTRFAILGPGLVKTKIHKSTGMAGSRAGANYRRTLEKLASGECVPIDKVVECCDWIIASPRQIVSGRNFSVAFDRWGNQELEDILRADQSMYKLRRWGNDRLTRSEPITEKALGRSTS